MLVLRFALLSLIVIVGCAYAYSTDNKENIQLNNLSDSQLTKKLLVKEEPIVPVIRRPKINEIASKIQKAHKDFDYELLQGAYQTFLDITDKEWDLYAIDKIAEWPKQKSKRNIIGGHIFFPQCASEWLDCRYRRIRLENPVIIYSLALSTTFQHTIARLLLAYSLDKTEYNHLANPEQELSEFVYDLYDNAVDEIKELDTQHPCKASADYLLGKLESGGFVTNRFEIYRSIDDVRARHEKYHDVHNKFAAFDLSYRTRYGSKKLDKHYFDTLDYFIKAKVQKAVFAKMGTLPSDQQRDFLKKHADNFPILNLELGRPYVSLNPKMALSYFSKIENIYSYEVEYLKYDASTTTGQNVRWMHFLDNNLRRAIEKLVKNNDKKYLDCYHEAP